MIRIYTKYIHLGLAISMGFTLFACRVIPLVDPNSNFQSNAKSTQAHVALGPISLAPGSDHTCALKSGGVWCWGKNESGQLGNGTQDNSSIPVPVFGLTEGVKAIASGGDRTCAILNEGPDSLVCWGKVYPYLEHQISVTSIPTPIQDFYEGVESVAIGEEFICAVKAGGVHCWGDNRPAFEGRFFSDSTFGLNSDVKNISAGRLHACASKKDGQVLCWGGKNTYNELGNKVDGAGHKKTSPAPLTVVENSSTIKALALGDSHSCAIVNERVQCWGRNSLLQLGTADKFNPERSVIPNSLNSGVQAITSGYFHSCALLKNGSLRCWGNNEEGQLGDGSVETSSTVIDVPSFEGQKISQVAAGAYHTCAIVDDKPVCWGRNTFGQLGNNQVGDFSRRPVPVQSF